MVKVSNSLNRASYTLSLPEKRLLMLAVSHLDHETSDGMIHITANEFADFFALNRDGAYRTLKNASENLWSRTLVTEDGTKYRWIITSKYNEGGTIELEFHPKLKPHLLQIKNNFTQYFLHRASNFKLMYTWRLFELLMQFRNTGLLVISLDDFKKSLDVPNAYNKDFGKIRDKVITPALNEILEKDGLVVDWKPLKTGRKVTGLEFRFPAEKQAAMPHTIETEVISKHYTRADLEKDSSLAKPGESYEQALSRLNHH
jgi:plasmid replication initiation protein